MAVSIKAATATVNSTSKKSTKATKENTVTMTAEQLQTIIAAAIAQATTQVAATTVAVVAPIATKQTLDLASSGSVSNRFINWTGSIIKTAAEKTAPVVGKVEVLAVPVTLHATGYMLSKSASIGESISGKLSKWGKATSAASIARTPGVEMTNLEAQLNGMSKADLIALIAQSAK